MARNRIFISYSHQDEKLFKELLVYLKPWQDRQVIDLWTDLDIKATQKWHEEIQEAVRSTAVAVLLISPDFMASDHIRKQQLPLFLKAAEERQLALACLYLRQSQVADDDYAFTVTLDSGESRKVKLANYQGLNKPDEILTGKPKKRRDELFVNAVQQIKALYKQYVQEGRLKPPPSRQRHELTIRLELSGNHLFRTCYSQQSRLATSYSDWPALWKKLRVWRDRGRLNKKIDDLQRQWDLLNEKLSGLNEQWILETRVEEKLLLENLINDTQTQRDQIEKQLKDMESQFAEVDCPWVASARPKGARPVVQTTGFQPLSLPVGGLARR